MHEVGMIQNILDAAVKRAKDEGASRASPLYPPINLFCAV